MGTASHRYRRWAAVAIAWAVAFAAISFYWAAGGRWGLGTLATSLQQKAHIRDPDFVALVWVTGALKLVVVPLVLAMARRRWVRAAGWLLGSLLVLYGGVNLIGGVLAELGVVEPVDPDAARWYLVLWGPVWVMGGVSVLGAAWSARRSSLSGDLTTAEVVNSP